MTRKSINHEATQMFNRTLKLIFAGIFATNLGIQTISAQSVGLKIEDAEVGTGAAVEAGMTIFVHYTGKLTDGKIFDSSVSRGTPFSFTIGQGQVIRGWEQGLLGMKVGGKRILTIPPDLGYGATGAGEAIPSNATLIFDIELMDIKEPVKMGLGTPDDLKAAQTKGAIVIDIRSKKEWEETGIIKGARTITAFTGSGLLHPDFQEKFYSLIASPDAPIVLYCRTGNRSKVLGDALINQAGLTNVTHLTDGIVGWEKGGNKTVLYQAKQ
jgi:rhodanese-related sulfurtransferase